MVPSDLRRPERWRGRVRGHVAAWSVIPVAAVVLVVGGLFWASVWTVLRTPTTRATNATSDLQATSAPSVYEDDRVTGGGERPVNADGQTAVGQYAGAEDSPEIEATTAASVDWPTELAGPGDGSYSPEAGAQSDPADESVAASDGQAAERAEELTAKAEGLTAKADELTAKAETLTAKAEELTVRLDGLTAKLEELEAKLDASATALAPRPAAVPSPVAVARPRESLAARDGQATSGTRPPWVVLPLPEPGSRVTAGPLVIETRARGEAPITQIRLQLDGVAVPVALERRDDTTWRGRATTRVSAGSHAVAVAVVDVLGRVGSYRWNFDAVGS